MKLFRAFRLDPANQCLWRGEQRVPLTPKAFDVLRYFVEHAGRLVTHDELLDSLWPETYVNPELIKKYILGIRKVLGDQHENPSFIETIPKRGYQFVAPVADAADADLSEPASPAKSRMVGREDALRELQSAYAKALRGRRQIVFISGEPGIGKTTLVDLFHQRASFAGNVKVGRGQCAEGFGGKEPYHPILEALGQLAGTEARDHLIEALTARAPTWLIQFPSFVKAEQGVSLQRETVGATRERMVREICDALALLCTEVPLVLVLEDLHWADPSTLDFISLFARRREPVKLMLVCTYRPVDVILSNTPVKVLKQDLHAHQLCSEITLERLSEGAIAEYLEAEFSGPVLPSQISNLIYRHSGGNPLFMTAILRELVDKGFVVQTAGEWTISKPLSAIDPGVPHSLQQMLEVQFETLSEREQRILEPASVVGETFSAGLVARVLQDAIEVVEDLCDGLAARHQAIHPVGSEASADGAVSTQYEFRHSVYRHAIHRRIPPGKRARLHRAVADRLQDHDIGKRRDMASAIAFHFEEGREYGQAIEFLIVAAENAAARFAYRDCIQVLQHALTLLPRLDKDRARQSEVTIHEFIGDVHYVLGDMAAAAAAYELAASRASHVGDKADQIRALSSMARPFGFIDPDVGIDALRRAVTVAASMDDVRIRARTEMLAAAYRLLYDRWCDEDAARCGAAHKELRDLGDATPPFHEMFYAHVQVLQGNYDEALAIFETGIPTAERPASLMEHFFALSGQTVALLRVGKLGEVLRIIREGKRMAEKNGNDPWLFNFREAWLRMLVLDFEGSVQVCESIVRKSVPSLMVQPETIGKIARGYAAIADGFLKIGRGDHQRAVASFRDARDEKVTPKFFLHWLWRMIAQRGLSEAWLQSKQIDKATREADAHLHAALQAADPHLQALAWELQARVAAAQERNAQADECIQNAVEILQRFDVPVAGWQVHATAWRLCSAKKSPAESERHRKQAAACITKIAHSFSPDEPLRQKFLSAAPVAKVLEGAVAAQSARTG